MCSMKVPEQELQTAELNRKRIERLTEKIYNWKKDKFLTGNEFGWLQDILSKLEELEGKYAVIEIVEQEEYEEEHGPYDGYSPARNELEDDEKMLLSLKSSYEELWFDVEHGKECRPPFDNR